MGALARATAFEIEELVSGDAHWWGGFLASVAEEGQEAIKRERDLRGWSWGALWGWMVADKERYAQYMQALEAYVQDKALETIGIADGADEDTVAAAKLQVDTRFKLAGKVDRARWGDKVAVDGGGGVVLDGALLVTMGSLLERLARPVERPTRIIEASAEVPADEI